MKPTLKALIPLVALALSACGFKPMHAPTGLGASDYNYSDLSVVTPDNSKEDFLLKQALRERIGTNSNTRYVLSIDPKVSRSNLGIGSDDVASRYDLTMTTNIVLRDGKTNEALFQDSIRAVSTYGASRDPYGSVSAQANATEQVAAESADRILVRLASYFSQQGRNASGG